MATTTIEDIILQRDQRGVSDLRQFLPQDYCHQAAQYVMDHPGTTLVTTGFYIVYGKAAETDGPPGALAIGRALEALGRRVVYVTDRYTKEIMQRLAGPAAEVADFPITDVAASQKFSEELLRTYDPSLLISIERCAPSRDGLYRNMRAVDITEYTARIDTLFGLHQYTVGVGDGGNEIGMGNVLDKILDRPHLHADPATTLVQRLVISSVSNWGGYGLVAALSRLAGRDLLPSVEEEAEWVRQCVALGAVDGFTGEVKEYVDGFPLDEYGRTLADLHDLLGDEGISSV